MRVTHSLTVRAICPVDQKPDVYTLIVRTTGLLPVEKILEAVESLTKVPTFQEDLTQALHRALACEVETQGSHSGVFTVVVCGEEE
jgi:hypothetical protein